MRVRGKHRSITSATVAAAAMIHCGTATQSPVAARPDASNADSAMPPDTGCVFECEMHLWPRVIVGLYPDEESSAAVQISARGLDGVVRPGQRRGCPADQFTQLTCSYSFFAGESETKLTIQVSDVTSQSEFEVPLGQFNHCGRDITYVPLERQASGWILGQVRLISPCTML